MYHHHTLQIHTDSPAVSVGEGEGGRVGRRGREVSLKKCHEVYRTKKLHMICGLLKVIAEIQSPNNIVNTF